MHNYSYCLYKSIDLFFNFLKYFILNISNLHKIILLRQITVILNVKGLVDLGSVYIKAY